MNKDLPNIFAHNPLDRATYRRQQSDWIRQVERDGFILPVWRGQIFSTSPETIGFVKAGLLRPQENIGQIFLGLDKKEKAYFACPLEGLEEPRSLLQMGEFLDLRQLAGQISADDAAIAAQARALIGWHENHLFCAACGRATRAIEAGHKRFCPHCEREHFPRTDPVVIMLIYHEDQAFLGRQKNWPPGFFSALAGFIEPGETIEEAVIRESFEEAQIHIDEIYYHSTQPWPWPYSLMIGCMAKAKGRDFTIDGLELEDGRWFDREQLKRMMEAQADESYRLPPPMAIARRLIHHFALSD